MCSINITNGVHICITKLSIIVTRKCTTQRSNLTRHWYFVIRKEEIVETKLAIPFTKVCNGMSPVISLHIFSSDSSCQQGPGNKSKHYENSPMQHTAIFQGCKNGNFQFNVFDNFHIFAQNIDCGCTLEPPH